MWNIKHIFDGDYGCEEADSGSKPVGSVTLENESGGLRYETEEDSWLTEKGLDVGSVWTEKQE